MPPVERTRRLFLRLVGAVYLVAFASLAVQIEGLLGPEGLRPAGLFLERIAARLDGTPAFAVPTVFWWLGASDAALLGVCGAGIGGAAALLLGLAPLPLLVVLWLLYLSLVSVGAPFLSFQWDALLLETGFLAIFWAPLGWRLASPGMAPPSRVVLWLLRWLVFRLMFFSGWVKLASGDPTWWDLSALEFHFWTQPLPSWTSWYAGRLPAWALRLGCALVFLIELVLPFAILAGRRGRLAAALGFTLLQVGIAATGNYGFFNLLTVVLCIPLLDDAWLGATGSRMPQRPPQLRRHARRVGRVLADVALAILLLGLGLPLAWRQLTGLPSPLDAVLTSWTDRLEPYRLVNPYGLFAVMTRTRPEVIVEGSDDGATWRPYDFPWKPGALERRPGFAGPHMPRLDWQMWFDGLAIERVLASGRGAYDLVTPSLLDALRRGSPTVLELLAANPFPAAPPRNLRWRLYQYRFTDAAERAASGRWWQRELVYTSEPTS